MQNENKLKLQRQDVLTNRGDAIDLLPWQEEAIREYVPKGSHIHSLFRLKDEGIDCGFEIEYCFNGITVAFTGWLN